MDLRGAPREFITQFIETYRDNPALWNTATLEYRNKKKKKAGYEALINVTNVYYEKVTLQDVKKRINSMRSCFRREKTKCSLKSKNGEVYKPALWYYEMLSFLSDVVSTSSFSYLEVSLDGSGDEGPDDDVDFHKIYVAGAENDSDRSTPSPPPSPPSLRPTLRKRPFYSEPYQPPKIIEQKSLKNTHTNCDDEFDIMGKGFANKLRRISKLSRSRVGIAEKLINDVLFQAEFVDISTDARIVNLPQHRPKDEHNDI